MNGVLAPAYDDASRRWLMLEGDALALMPQLPEHSIDAIVCDPPYGLALAGAAWDDFGSRRAGKSFEDWTRAWATACRRVLKPGGHLLAFGAPRTFHRLVSGVEDAGLEVRDQVLWMYGQGIPKSRRLPGGLGTTLKPAFEPVLIARAPLEGPVAENLARWGTGALGIEAARVQRVGQPSYWPANIVLSHSPDCPVDLLDQSGDGPSRFFYCAKTTRPEREAGCEQLPLRATALYTGRRRSPRLVHNAHVAVKPVEVMRWLIRLGVPEGGVVLDPFAGSGTTGIAATLEGRFFLGIEREPEYVDIACARLAHWAQEEG